MSFSGFYGDVVCLPSSEQYLGLCHRDLFVPFYDFLLVSDESGQLRMIMYLTDSFRNALALQWSENECVAKAKDRIDALYEVLRQLRHRGRIHYTSFSS